MRLPWPRLALLLALTILLGGTLAAYAASNTVPATRIDDDSIAITANDLKPSDCAALNLTNIVAGSGTLNGTNANDLILGSAAADRIRGRQGADCILGGDGNDNLRGDRGGDVLLGGNGDDALWGAQGADVCDGEGGTDTGDPSCEVERNIP